MAYYSENQTFPSVIKWLLISNVSIFLLSIFISEFRVLSLVFGGLWPLQSGNFLPWQLLSYQFIHDANGFTHILFNMLALWMFGSEMERHWGSKRFIFYYILCGIGAGIIHMIVSPFLTANGAYVPTVGASGAIMGVLIGYGFTFPDRPVMMFPFFIPIPAKYFVLIYAGIDLIMGLTNTRSGVAHFAHLGGAATGYILLLTGDKLYSFVQKLFAKKSKKTVPGRSNVVNANWVEKNTNEVSHHIDSNTKSYTVDGEIVTQRQIDEILERISRYGYQNITDKERRILTEVSKKL